MPIQYVNRRGDTYFLHEGKTKTGKTKWFFSKKAAGNLAEAIPAGFEIYENHDALVLLRKIVPLPTTEAEIETVEDGVRKFAAAAHFLVEAKGDSIVVFVADDETDYLEKIAGPRFGLIGRDRLASLMQRYLRYMPMMRFVLVDEEERLFSVERWCFRGSIDDWIPLAAGGDLASMVKKYAPHLGKESFYDLM
jgi:hypothetical protein